MLCDAKLRMRNNVLQYASLLLAGGNVHCIKMGCQCRKTQLRNLELHIWDIHNIPFYLLHNDHV